MEQQPASADCRSMIAAISLTTTTAKARNRIENTGSASKKWVDAPRVAASNVRNENTRNERMRMVKYFLMAVLTMGLVAGLGVFQAADNAKPKYTIEEVMEKAHKPAKTSLFVQVKTGKASAEQKKQLLELYEEMAKNPAPKSEKGNAADWKKRTGDLVKATKDVIADKEGATKELAKAATCSKCHSVYKNDD